MIAYAVEKGLGVVIMGPVGGGRLAAPTDLYAKLTGKPAMATYELAFKFVLGNPGVSCALSGMQDMDMIDKNLLIAGQGNTLTTQEWKQLGEAVEQLKKFSDLYCTGCEYCQPCPVGINIPHIFNMFTYHNVYGLRDHAKHEMTNYLKDGGKTIKDCSDCGRCEKKCPQNLEIRKQLKRVEEILTII
jgi:predicted aldo/keto reductase-like oxidoreductase